MIQVNGVTKRYGPATAVKNVSFEVERGEIVGFLGPNGAGKTTTMRILTGFLPPTEGAARVAGFDVVEQPLEVKSRIGYLPETPPLYPEMEVDSYLDFVARLKGIASADIPARIDNVLDRCSLGDVRGKLTGKLSKGYRQRVGLAQALIHSPDVLILDEPTSGLDPKQIIEVRELIHHLAGEHTIILSTHILSEVSETCSRIIIIADGKIEASDTPDRLIARLQQGAAAQIEIDGPVDQIEAKLAAITGVAGVARGADANGRSIWNVESEKGTDVRNDLARAVVESGWGLYGLRASGMSLEQVFLKLTAAEQAEAQVESAPESASEISTPEASAEETEAEADGEGTKE